MLDCNKCGFHVNGNLKYAISSNTCPSCGNSLLNNEDIRSVEEVRRELINNGFSFSDSDMRLLGIYFTKKIKTLLDENQETLFKEDISEELENDNILTEEYKDFKEEILKEVQQEAYSKVEEEEFDPEDKVERLRRKAKNSPILKKQGVSVRRVQD
jgi:rRNA maturation protein Nop10